MHIVFKNWSLWLSDDEIWSCSCLSNKAHLIFYSLLCWKMKIMLAQQLVCRMHQVPAAVQMRMLVALGKKNKLFLIFAVKYMNHSSSTLCCLSGDRVMVELEEHSWPVVWEHYGLTQLRHSLCSVQWSCAAFKVFNCSAERGVAYPCVSHPRAHAHSHHMQEAKWSNVDTVRT